MDVVHGDGFLGCGRMRVLGLPVDPLTPGEAVEAAARAIRRRRRCRILVGNANKAWLAARDARLRTVVDGVEIVLPEWAMCWAAARLGHPGLPLVRGIGLTRLLLEAAAAHGWSVYLLGGEPGVPELLAGRLPREVPGLCICGCHHGHLDDGLDARVRQELRAVRPELLFVAMGSPRQEYWIGGLPPDAGPLVCMGVGGSFDVLAGRRREAPPWMRGRGLEWIYRMVQDPVRLGPRYLVTNTWLIWSVLRERLRTRGRRGA